MNDYIEFKNKLRKLQEEHNLTQEDMAEIIDVSGQPAYSNKLANGRFNLDELCKLADYFNVSIDELIGRDSFVVSEYTIAKLLKTMLDSGLIEVYTDKEIDGFKYNEVFDFALYQKVNIPTIHIKSRYIDKYLFDFKKLLDGFSPEKDRDLFDSWFGGMIEKASKEQMEDSWLIPEDCEGKDIVYDVKQYALNKVLANEFSDEESATE